jgi:hypothetical protein
MKNIENLRYWLASILGDLRDRLDFDFLALQGDEKNMEVLLFKDKPSFLHSINAWMVTETGRIIARILVEAFGAKSERFKGIDVSQTLCENVYHNRLEIAKNSVRLACRNAGLPFDWVDAHDASPDEGDPIANFFIDACTHLSELGIHVCHYNVRELTFSIDPKYCMHNQKIKDIFPLLREKGWTIVSYADGMPTENNYDWGFVYACKDTLDKDGLIAFVCPKSGYRHPHVKLRFEDSSERVLCSQIILADADLVDSEYERFSKEYSRCPIKS